MFIKIVSLRRIGLLDSVESHEAMELWFQNLSVLGLGLQETIIWLISPVICNH